ncbi:MAG: hypothetical protein KGL53_12195, partial [Elusimicrobia bacterium]|nr:hypothetical protein [Elusimicrobiota bacterium]
MIPLLTGAAAGALYLTLPSLRHNFDGVACAIAVELGDVRHLVHGNHLVYGLVGWLFYRVVNGVGLPVPALWSLQLMDSLLGALGAGLFARHLLRRGRAPAAAAAASLGLAVSWGWWLRSLDAQVYLLAAPFVILFLDEALSDRPRPMRIAVLHTGAMLVHASHALLAPAALWSLWRGEPDPAARKRAVGRYLAFCASAVVAAYAAALTECVRPASMAATRLWLLGSAALGPGRSYHWLAPSSPLSGLRFWAGTSLGVVSVVPAAGLGLWALAVWGASRPRAGRERTLAVLWVLPYALFFVNWEPWNKDYRIMDLVPLWALAAAAVPE